MLVSQFDAFVIDLAVVYIGEGRPLPEAPETLAALRRQRTSTRFITNDPRLTRVEIADRLLRAGVQAAVDEVVSSAWATARWLHRQGVTRTHSSGGPALRHEPWPQDVRAGVAAVVLDGTGRVLLGRRVDNGLWGLPSGHVEAGETVEQAIVREVAEVTGLRVEVTRLTGVYSDPASQVFIYPDGRVTQFVTVCFACSPREGRMRPDGVETSEVAFFSPDRLPAALLPMHPRWLTDARAS